MLERVPLYYAYGSNLSARQMVRRCPSSRFESRAILRGHRLVFPRTCQEWGGGVAGIVPDSEAQVEGVVWSLTESDLARLDEYEGLGEGQYTRDRVEVARPDESRVCVWTYIAVPEGAGDFAPPGKYVQTILEGGKEHGLSQAWIAQIERLLEEGTLNIDHRTLNNEH